MDFRRELRARIKTPDLGDELEKDFQSLLDGIIFQDELGNWHSTISNQSENKLEEKPEIKGVLERVLDSAKKENVEATLGKYNENYNVFNGGVESTVFKLSSGKIAIVQGNVDVDECEYVYNFLVHLALYCFFKNVKKFTEDEIPIVAIDEMRIGNFTIVENKKGSLAERNVVIIEEFAGKTFEEILNNDEFMDKNYQGHFISFLKTLKRFRDSFSLNHTDLHTNNVTFKKNANEDLICKIIDLGLLCSFNTIKENKMTKRRANCNTRDEDVYQFIYFFCLHYFRIKNQGKGNKENILIPKPEDFLKKLIPTKPMEGIKDVFPIFGPILIRFLNKEVPDRFSMHWIFYGNNLYSFLKILMAERNEDTYEAVKRELSLERLLPLCEGIMKHKEKIDFLFRNAFPRLNLKNTFIE